jgi:hypothetical protein
MDKVSDERKTHLRLRFSKSVYLLVLMLISVNFFHFFPISKVTDNDICLVAFLFWLILGHFLYKPLNKWLSLSFRKGYWPFYAVWVGIIISFLPARTLYGQSFVTSLITSRAMLSMVALPFLFVIQPTRSDVENAAKWFSIILLVFAILDALNIPIIDRTFFMDEEKPKKLIDDDSFVMLLPGFQWVGISLLFCLDRMKKLFSTRNLLSSIFFFAGVFLLQNRSMLFICAILFAYTFFSVRGKTAKQTAVIRYGTLLILAIIIGTTIPQWIKLFNETTSQLSNFQYNRLLAYNYFLFEACPSAIYYFTGTGMISAHASSIMKDLMDVGIYNSDVGFVGLWNYYGIIPIVAIVIMALKGMKKGTPFYLKFNAIFILIGGATIACFTSPDKILWLCAFIYLVYDAQRTTTTAIAG